MLHSSLSLALPPTQPNPTQPNSTQPNPTPQPQRSAIWNAALPEDQRPPGWRDDASSSGTWHALWGDRCQQLVWIGVGMDEAALRAMLDGCLLTDEEMRLGPEGWAAAFQDELPAWVDGEEEGFGEEWGEGELEEGEEEGEGDDERR